MILARGNSPVSRQPGKLGLLSRSFPSHDRIVKEHFYVPLRRFMMQAYANSPQKHRHWLAKLSLECSSVRCRLQIVLIATTIWLPVQANGKSVFVGIDGRAHTSAEIDATITHVMQAAEVPGLVLALINDGKVVYLKAYGVKNMSPNEPLTVNSVMVAGSLTKVAFAYLVMKLVDDHVIDLDKPVYEYLPRPLSDYPTWRDIANDPRSKLITTRMLLSHTAGFNNSRYFDPDHRLVIHFEPGTRYSYGSEGYSLIQLVVETVTKKSTEELMRQHVFGPLGMTRTSMVWQNAFESDHANGYDEYGRSLGIQKRQTPRGRLYAGDAHRLCEIDTGGPLRSRSSQADACADAERADPHRLKVRIPATATRHYRRVQGHPVVLWSRCGSLPYAPWVGFLQGRPR